MFLQRHRDPLPRPLPEAVTPKAANAIQSDDSLMAKANAVWADVPALFSKAEGQEGDQQTSTLAEGHLLMDTHNKQASAYSVTGIEVAITQARTRLKLPTTTTLQRVPALESGSCFFDSTCSSESALESAKVRHQSHHAPHHAPYRSPSRKPHVSLT